MRKQTKFGTHQKKILVYLARRGIRGASFDGLHKLIFIKIPQPTLSYIIPILLRLQKYGLIIIDWETQRVLIGALYDPTNIT